VSSHLENNLRLLRLFANIRERIEREGGEDQGELRNALDQVERLLEARSASGQRYAIEV